MPAWKKKLQLMAQYIKEFLPDSLFYALLDSKMQKYRAPYEKKIMEEYSSATETEAQQKTI